MNLSGSAWCCRTYLPIPTYAAFLLCLFLLPGLTCANLLCYYCPLQLVNKPCKHVLTECPPGQKCFTANGNYGGYSGIFSKGCILENKCQRKNSQSIREESNVSLGYFCCSDDYCNSGKHWTVNHRLLALTAVAVMIYALR